MSSLVQKQTHLGMVSGEGGVRVEYVVSLLSHFSFFSTILQYENFPINAISAFIQKETRKLCL